MVTTYYGHTYGLLCWLSYWSIYWLFSPLFPSDDWKKDNIDKKGRYAIYKKVIQNSLVILIVSMIVSMYCSPICKFLFIKNEYTRLVAKFVASLIYMEVSFYTVHRLFHHPYFYQYHKLHHSLRGNYPVTGLYCSLYEAIGCDFLSGIGPILFDMDIYCAMIWYVYLALHSLKLHSNYTGKFLSSQHHNVHHQKFIYNYGFFNITDKIMGTLY